MAICFTPRIFCVFGNWKFSSRQVKKLLLSFNFRRAVYFLKRIPLAADIAKFFLKDDNDFSRSGILLRPKAFAATTAFKPLDKSSLWRPESQKGNPMSSTALRAVSREVVSPAESLFLLVVDGERWVRDLCKEVAGSMGFKVYTAENTQAALRQMEIQPVDVVLLDVRQSAQEGLELLAKFKEKHPQTEVIMLSGQASIDSVVSAMKNGACDFLRKPFKSEELKALLTRAAGR